MAKRLTEKRKQFVLDYLKDMNGTRAYLAVFNNCKSENAAAVNASKLLALPEVKEFKDEKLAEIQSAKIADVSEVMEYLTSVMRGEEQEQVLVGVGMGEQTIDDKDICAKDRIKAAELIGKRYGMFSEKVDISGAMVVIEGEDNILD